jgi:signal transduction histidine kinase
VNLTRPVQRYLGLGVLIAMAGFVALGYYSIRRDVENLRVISQDNILWTATQMEVELLRFQLSVANLEIERTPEALAEVRERFDILWSRVFMMGSGRVGELIRRYDQGHGSIPAFRQYLEELDPVVAGLAPDDSETVRIILQELETFRHDLRLYTLRVVRGDTAASAQVRDRIQYSSQTTMAISLAAVLLSVLALALILHENRRQREVAELNRRVAEEAEMSSRAKSRFLTMMSHELRNPLNGVLGPLALLGQSDLASRHLRLVEQAQQSGRSMMQMLAGLLDYGEMQDGRFHLRVEPFRIAALAAGVREDLARGGSDGVRVALRPGGAEFVHGDAERLRHVFVHLTEYVLEGSEPKTLDITFEHDGERLIGEIRFAGGDAAIDWKLDLMMGLSDIAPDQVSTEALRPLIARGLIAAARGVLSLVDVEDGRRAIRVAIPAPRLRYDRIRVRLETRSTALSAIYQAALRSERIVFVGPDEPGSVDMVLVDATSVGEEPLMAKLRLRFPEALFVSLGAPQQPDSFDDIVDGPADMTRLRSRILGRLAS